MDCSCRRSQRQYASDLLQRAGMSECHSTLTPVDSKSKLSASDGPPVVDPSEYRSIVGALQYLTLTRPDLAYAILQVCLFMHDPRELHLALVKRILRYVKGTLDASLSLGAGPVDTLTSYSDADWVGCPDSRRSTSGYCVYLGDNLVSWSSKRQTTVSRSRLNIGQLHMLLLSVVGCISCFRSFMFPSPRLLLSTMTTLVLYI